MQSSAFDKIYNKLFVDVPVILEADEPGTEGMGAPPPPPPSSNAAGPATDSASKTETSQTSNEEKPEEVESKDEEKNGEDDKEKDEAKDKKKKSIEEMKNREIEKRDELIEKFNTDNSDSTIIKLIPYEKTPDYSKAFKVTVDVSPEEIYLDRPAYLRGKSPIEVTEIFYRDLSKMASSVGIKRIEWRSDDEGTFGVISIDPNDVVAGE